MFGNAHIEQIRKTRSKDNKNAQTRREAKSAARRRKAERSAKKALRVA
jgi:hypothetical protein